MDNQLTLKQLKENLRETLVNSGVISNVKAHIRRDLYSSLTSHGIKPKSDNDRLTNNLHDRVVYSLIYHALFQRKLTNALSVFIAECGFDVKSFLLSESDIVATLQLGTKSPIFKKIMNKENSIQSDTLHSLQSLLDELIEHSFSTMNNKTEAEIQTDSSGCSALDFVDFEMKEIRKMYLKRKEDDRMNPVRSIEERMIAFERECEERYRRDLDYQTTYIRQNESAKIRLEERQKARLELEAVKKELETDFKFRQDSHYQREQELNRRSEEKDRHFQQTLYDARQKMQQEIDDLRNREQLVSRKIELEKQGLNALELRIKESKIMLENRENEVARREKEVETKMKDMAMKSKEEARDHLREEMAATMTERSLLISDRQRFEEEKGYHQALIENANLARQQLHELQTALLMKDDEIASYKRRLEHIEARRSEEFEMKGKPGYSANLVTLIHRNAELEAQLREREDLNTIAKNEEVQRLTLKSKELAIELEMERKSFLKECELLRQEAQLERSKSSGLQAKCHELEKQNLEYKNLLGKIQSTNRRENDNSKAHRDVDHAKRISEMVEGVVGRPPSKHSVGSRAREAYLSELTRGHISHDSQPQPNIDQIAVSQQSALMMAAMLGPYLNANQSYSQPFPLLPPRQPFSGMADVSSIPVDRNNPVQQVIYEKPNVAVHSEQIKQTPITQNPLRDQQNEGKVSPAFGSPTKLTIHIDNAPAVNSPHNSNPPTPQSVVMPSSKEYVHPVVSHQAHEPIPSLTQENEVPILSPASPIDSSIALPIATHSPVIKQLVSTSPARNETNLAERLTLESLISTDSLAKPPIQPIKPVVTEETTNLDHGNSTNDLIPSTPIIPVIDAEYLKKQAAEEAALSEQRRLEEDRLAILEAKRRVLDRRNKRRDGSDLTVTASLTASEENPFKSWSSAPTSTRSSLQGSIQTANEDPEEVLSVNDEFETPAPEGESNSSDSSNGGWF